MGRVYEAFDVGTDRNVAVKLLHSDVAKDSVSVERFKREFAVSQLLPHEHIVEVFDFQPTPDGSYALVMEFLYGEELRNTIKREKMFVARSRRANAKSVGLGVGRCARTTPRSSRPQA